MHILEAALVTNLASATLQPPAQPAPARRWPRPSQIVRVASAAAALAPLALLLPMPL